MRKTDICAFCETWGKTESDFDNFVPGFHNFSTIRPKRSVRGRHSGGVTVLVNSSLVELHLIERIYSCLQNCVILKLDCLHFTNISESIILCFVYISPEYSPVYNNMVGQNGVDNFEANLLRISIEYPDSEIFIAGDMNARCGLLQDVIFEDDVDHILGEEAFYESDNFSLNRESKDQTHNNFGLSLIEMCKMYGIHILNGRFSSDKGGNYTCIANDGASIVDYMIASSSLFPLLSDFKVGDRSETVHFPLMCTLTLEESVSNREYDNILNDANHANCEESFTKFRWNEEKKNDFIIKFQNVLHSSVNNIMVEINSNLDIAVDMITSVYHQAAEHMKIRPFSLHGGSEQPAWWDDQCETMKRQKQQALVTFRSNTNDITLMSYKKLRNEFKHVCDVKKKTFQLCQRQKLVDARFNLNMFWRTVKQMRYRRLQTANIPCSQWYNHFKALLYNNEAGVIDPDQWTGNDENPNDILNVMISEAEITKSIISLNSGKSGGPNGMVSEMIKCTLNEMTPVLHSLYNTVFTSGQFPRAWGQSILCPVHKKGSWSDTDNFRGISLIDVLNKVFTGILNERLCRWAEVNNVIDESQAGFRKGYSTIDNLFTLQAMVQKYLSKRRGRFYCLFI
ncbi:MAG: hypothetical protein ABW185_03125, partial [Sedimenticola sp.]